MATTTVKHGPSHASASQVKSKQGFFERRREARAARQATPEAEHDTYPQWDAPTQAIPAVPVPQTAPQVLYRERPADLDTAACNIALVATGATLHRHSAIKFEENLAKHLKMVHALAQQERAEGQKLLERHERTADTPSAAAEGIREVVRAEERANGLAGVAVRAQIDTEAYGRDLGAAWSNAHALDAETAQFQPITPGMPDPRVTVKVEAVAASTSPSPVHVPGEDLRPAVPDEQEDADPGASSPLAREVLPRRPRVTVMSVPMADGESTEPVGLREVRPAYGGLGEHDWVLDEAGPGVRVLKLVNRVAIVYNGQSEPVGARVYFAAGGDRRVAEDRTVVAMSAADAEPRVRAREAQLDALELEASR